MYRIINLGRRRRRRRSLLLLLLLLLFIFCLVFVKLLLFYQSVGAQRCCLRFFLSVFLWCRDIICSLLKFFFHQKSQKRARDTEKPIARSLALSRSLALGKEERGAKRGARARWHLHRRRHRSVALAASHRCRRVYRERAMVLREEDNEEEEASSDGD